MTWAIESVKWVARDEGAGQVKRKRECESKVREKSKTT
jgi:hypothetical protein